MKIDHIALYVKDLEGAKDFFEKYFGGKSGNLYRNPSTGFSSYFIRFSTAILQPGSAHTLSASLTEVPAEPGLK